jgi:hypothetical protein
MKLLNREDYPRGCAKVVIDYNTTARQITKLDNEKRSITNELIELGRAEARLKTRVRQLRSSFIVKTNTRATLSKQLHGKLVIVNREKGKRDAAKKKIVRKRIIKKFNL